MERSYARKGLSITLLSPLCVIVCLCVGVNCDFWNYYLKKCFVYIISEKVVCPKSTMSFYEQYLNDGCPGDLENYIDGKWGKFIKFLDNCYESGDLEQYLSKVSVKKAKFNNDQGQIDSYSDNLRIYFITLTTTNSNGSSLISCVNKIMSSKVLCLQEYLYSVELTKNQVPHIHMLVVTKKYIKYRDILKFNNNERCEVKLIKGQNNVKNIIKYILKESDNDEVKKWCETHEMSQIVMSTELKKLK